MSVIQERYNPIPMAVNATARVYGDNIGGFLCQTSGTLTLVSNAHDGKAQTTLLNAYSVISGIYYPIPVFIGKEGGTVTLASGASGLLLV